MADLIVHLIAVALGLMPAPDAEPAAPPEPVVIDLTTTTVPPTTTIPEPVCDWTQGRTGQPAACYVYPA
jgi:hypothetical protein